MSPRKRISIPNKDAKQIERLARVKKITKQEVISRALKVFTFTQRWEAAQEAGKDVAKKLGIKSEKDVVRLFQ